MQVSGVLAPVPGDKSFVLGSMFRTANEMAAEDSHPVLSPPRRDQMDAPISPELSSRATRARSASHPLKIAFLTAKRALQSQFGDTESLEKLLASQNLPASLGDADVVASVSDHVHATIRSRRIKPNLCSISSNSDPTASYSSQSCALLILNKACCGSSHSPQLSCEVALDSDNRWSPAFSS